VTSARGGAAVALVLLTAIRAGAAEPPEGCAALEALAWRMNEDGQRFAALYGRSFYRPPREILDFRLRLDLARVARAACPHPEEPHGAHFHWVLRGSSASAPLQPVVESGSDIEDIQGALRGIDLSSVTVAAVERAMHHMGIDADPAAAAFVLNYLASSQREAILARARGQLSMAQMVTAAQYFGYLADQRYDYNKVPSIYRRAVSTSQVTAAAAAELMGIDPYLVAGNCSDIANAQGELLEKLGAKDVVVATTAHIIGLHSTVVAREPNTQTYYQINFYWSAHSSLREGADLFHVPGTYGFWADVGPGIYLNRPNGRTVGWVPNNAGKIYAEAAAMDIHEIEPLARATSSLLGAQLALPFGHSLQTFVARDPTGSYYAGVALSQAWAQRSHFPGAVGLVTAWRHIEPGLAVADVYLQLEQRAVSPALHLGSVLRASTDVTLIVIGSYSLPFSDAADNAQGADAAVLFNGGVQLAAGTPSSRLAGRLRVAAQLLPGVTNIGGATPTVFLNHLVISADARARLGQTRAGEVDLIADSAVLLDAFGPRVAAGVGVDSRRFGVRVEAMGRVLDGDPTYKEGSLRRGRLLASVPIVRWLRVSTLAEVQEGGTDAKWTLTGALEGRY
jgi:hypothetical protein